MSHLDPVAMSDADLGRMLKQAIKESGERVREGDLTRNGLASFLDRVGMNWLGNLVREAANIWREVRSWIDSLL